MTRAQKEFSSRDGQDSREFNTWYHNEDVQRLIWQMYQNLSQYQKNRFHKPYVFYDGLDATTTLDKLLSICHDTLSNSDLKYLPFIVKPMNSAHYYAGFVHKNPNYIYIFDPLGSRIKNSKFRDFFHVSSSDKIRDLHLIVSSESVQNKAYEDRLASCGPLCVEFLNYIMQNPDAIPLDLFPSSIIPEQFDRLIKCDKDTYEAEIMAIRNEHYSYLGHLSNTQLSSQEFAEFYAKLTKTLTEPYQFDKEKTTCLPENFFCDYTTNESQKIIDLIYKNVSPEKQQNFSPPKIFDAISIDDFEKTLLNEHKILKEKKSNYFPFLFKLDASQPFYAGLVLQNQLYLFVPGGALPNDNTQPHVHLGLRDKFFIKNRLAVLISQKENQPVLCQTKNMCTLLCTEFLNYIMQSDTAFNDPNEFLTWLDSQRNNESYIEQLSQKHKKIILERNVQRSHRPSFMYQQYFHELKTVLDDVERPTNDYSQAQLSALTETRSMIYQLNCVDEFLLNDFELLRLASVCSHVAQSLKFVTGHPMDQVSIFRNSGHSFEVKVVLNYDLEEHKKSMQFLSETASLLPGAGWYRLKRVLLILSGAMLLACGIIIASNPTMGVAFASAAAISAGVGFFVGRDKGLAVSVKKATMEIDTEQTSRHTPG
ncbi:MAG: hypothetical protein CK424_00165 [Legionella sp.]|nr:MAG: hypothetical protein CK424_00165 [Legionella sp.]